MNAKRTAALFVSVLLVTSVVATGAVFASVTAAAASGGDPVGTPDRYVTPTDRTLTIDAPGFLANDLDPDGENVSAVAIVDGVDNGTLSAFASGAFSYTPDAGFVGTDSFTYELADESGNVAGPVTVTVEVLPAPNEPPVVEAPDVSGSEGSTITATATFTDPDVNDTHTATIDWGDGTTDAATVTETDGSGTVTGTHSYADDGVYEANVTVCDGDDCGSDTFNVTVTNVAPAVNATGEPIDEGETATVSATFTDPGTADTHTATVDWGDGTVETVAVDQQAGGGSITATHTYGDDGDFEVTVNVTDDEGASGDDTATVSVANLAPVVTLDASTAVTLPSGEQAFLGRAGSEQTHSATATDPGSDDLTFSWSFGAETTVFNDGANPDPDPSPGGTFPFTASDTAAVTFSDPGVVEVGVTVTDDDGGRDEANLTKLVAGDAAETRSRGFWRKQYSDSGKRQYSDAELEAFLDVSTLASAVFSERTDADTVDAAHDVLSPEGPSMRAKAEAQALAAWLNFAAGGVRWDERIDTDGDGTPDTAFSAVMDEVESILRDSSASRADLERAKDLAEAVNLHDAGAAGGSGG